MDRLRSRAIGGYKFVRQKPIGPYVVDFVCRERRLIIEVDGGQHATDKRDGVRERWLERVPIRLNRKRALDSLVGRIFCGKPVPTFPENALTEHRYRVLRFWNNDVMGNIDGVLESIATALPAVSSPHPDRSREPTSPRKRGEVEPAARSE